MTGIRRQTCLNRGQMEAQGEAPNNERPEVWYTCRAIQGNMLCHVQD